MSSTFFKLKKPRIFAHRGYALKAPENSLPAFSEALSICEYIETDLHATQDGVLVFHHDFDLKRSCGVDKNLADIKFSELQKLRLLGTGEIGTDEKIPSAEEALTKFPDAHWNIEIKDPRLKIEDDVLALLKKLGAEERVLIAAENDEIMQRFRALNSNIPTSASHLEVFRIVQWAMTGIGEPPKTLAKAFQLPTEYSGIKLDRPELIALAHQLGIEVHYWTINDPLVAKKLLESGADGIITDAPDLISKIL